MSCGMKYNSLIEALLKLLFKEIMPNVKLVSSVSYNFSGFQQIVQHILFM